MEKDDKNASEQNEKSVERIEKNIKIKENSRYQSIYNYTHVPDTF